MTSFSQRQTTIARGGFGQGRLYTDDTTGQKKIRKYLFKNPGNPDVFKQSLNDKDLQEYNYISDIFQTIDPESKYFTGIALNLEGQSPKKFIQMQYGGSDLFEVLQSSKPDFCVELLERFSQLLEGLKLLLNYGYVHGDIKIENIVYDKEKGLRFIDYDFLDTIKNYKKGFKNGFLTRNRIPKIKFYDKCPPEFVDDIELKWFPEQPYLPTELIQKIRNYYRKNSKPALDFTKFDIWCLGLVVYGIFECAQDNLSPDKKTRLLKIILDNMLNPDPIKRDINKALKDWKKVFRKRTQSSRLRSKSSDVDKDKGSKKNTAVIFLGTGMIVGGAVSLWLLLKNQLGKKK